MRFIDLILTEWYDDEDRTKFLAGLANVDTQSHDLFGKDFVDCPAVQQKQLLTALDEELTEFRQAERYSAHRRQMAVPAHQPFFYAMKQLTLVGYFTSEQGAKTGPALRGHSAQHVSVLRARRRRGGCEITHAG